MTKKKTQRAIITVLGEDNIGIVAAITNQLAINKINILEITQTTLDGIFTMIMLVDLEKSSLVVIDLSDKLKKLGREISQEVTVHDEDIIRAMHRV